MEEKQLQDAEQRVETRVPHVQQAHTWDCGLACIKMALRYAGKSLDNFHHICRSMKFGESVWTIDLAHILAKYNIAHRFYTVTLGVDKGYSSKLFYRSNFDHDEERVNNLFENASSLGIHLEKRSVSREEILLHLSKGHIVIALVDWSYLSCQWCDHKCLPQNIGCMGNCLFTYQGHFVVVCGYDLRSNVIFYKNPSYKEELCCSSIKKFEQSRKSYGTDEDLLFIYKGSTEPATQDSPIQQLATT